MEHYTGSNVEIISKEMIKPSYSTPDHLKTVKLSLMDQITPPVYVTVIFFYEADELKRLNDDTAQICHRLKRSLSDTLTHFYLLTGKIDPDNFTIDCNDTGVDFIEARARDSRLIDIIRDPRPEQLQIYVPVGPTIGAYDSNDALFMAQVTFFDCGGIAVGVSAVHVVVDGPSLVEFMKAWSATCRAGQTLKSDQEFGAIARYFPARDLSDYDFSPSSLLAGHVELVTKRLVFNKEKLEALKREVVTTQNPTRVEVVSAFIWKHFIKSKVASKTRKRSVALHAVNMRWRAGPDMALEHAFGNCQVTTATEVHDEEGAPRLDELVGKLRRAIRRIDEEYIRKMHSEDRLLSEVQQLVEVAWGGEEVEGFLFSSWCRFPIYEVDFGWGRPVWVGIILPPLNNGAILADTRSGDGIEAWINMRPQNVRSLDDQFKLIGTDEH